MVFFWVYIHPISPLPFTAPGIPPPPNGLVLKWVSARKTR